MSKAERLIAEYFDSPKKAPVWLEVVLLLAFLMTLSGVIALVLTAIWPNAMEDVPTWLSLLCAIVGAFLWMWSYSYKSQCGYKSWWWAFANSFENHHPHP